LRRSCECVGLSRTAWYRPPVGRTLPDAEVIAALTLMAGAGPAQPELLRRELLRRSRPDWNHKRIYLVCKAMRLNLRRAATRWLPKLSTAAAVCATASRYGLTGRLRIRRLGLRWPIPDFQRGP